ncbi:MAG TPA: hypothetical protein VMJ10_21375 [Kofleriaceae bacterium]|nr:hypothetical protein [Kofleriaceae bacterium]
MRFVVAFAVAITLPSVASADPPGATPDATQASPPGLTPAEPTHRSYGLQVLAVDALSLGLMVGGGGGVMSEVGALGYAFGGAAIHLGHDRNGQALGSVLLHVGLPVLGGYIGYRMNYPNDDDEGPIISTFLGIAVGVAAATTIDATILAHDEDPAPPRWSPTFARTPRGGMTFGLARTF